MSTDQQSPVSELMWPGRHFIGGEVVEARSGETIDVLDPSTGEVISPVPRGTSEDVDLAMSAAAAALPGWRDMNPVQRSHLLWRWGDLCMERSRDLGMLESIETGKPVGDSIGAVMGLGYHLHYMAGLADKLLGATLPTGRPEVIAFTLREPHGVCGIIVPWNVPSYLMMRAVAPALAAGNTVVVKTAEDAPLTCLALCQLSLEAGIPPGVVNCISGYGEEAGAALAAHPDLGHMSFTGSPETGTLVMEACARNHVPLHLELGGKSPHIVFADAQLEKAIPLIVGHVVANAGQMCFAGTRLLVEEPLRQELVGALSGAFSNVKVGRWHEEGVQMGPVINADQEKRVLDYIEVGKQEGAKVTAGGGKLTGNGYDSGFFVRPTIFDEVAPDMTIAQEEIFGPVLSVIPFKEPDEAATIANSNPYGLMASVWTNDLSQAVELARRLEAGQVYFNTYFSRDAIGAPFGGYKRSGFGRTQGYDTILEYAQTKTVIIDGGE